MLGFSKKAWGWTMKSKFLYMGISQKRQCADGMINSNQSINHLIRYRCYPISVKLPKGFQNSVMLQCRCQLVKYVHSLSQLSILASRGVLRPYQYNRIWQISCPLMLFTWAIRLWGSIYHHKLDDHFTYKRNAINKMDTDGMHEMHIDSKRFIICFVNEVKMAQ